MHKPRICISIGSEHIDNLVKKIEIAKEYNTWIELRADYLEHLSPQSLEVLDEKTKGVNTILTIRRESDGGKFTESLEQLEILHNKAFELDFKYIDIDYNLKNLLKKFKVWNPNRIILSTHNFEFTPPEEELEELANDMLKEGTGLIKIACKANSAVDVENLRKLIERLGRDKSIIVAMGEIAKESRIEFPLIGSFLTFANLREDPTASGQYSIDEMINKYERINFM
jgi:3-dehydroquinate dehydratase type I